MSKKLPLNYHLLGGIIGKKFKTWELVEDYEHQNDFDYGNTIYRETKDNLQRLKNQLKEDE